MTRQKQVRYCQNCHKAFHPWSGYVGYFCSRQCLLDSNRYAFKTRKGDGLAKSGIYISMGNRQKEALHRLIGQSILGRQLREKEVIHHVNGNCYDNRLINLALCKRSTHDTIHRRTKLRRVCSEVIWQ